MGSYSLLSCYLALKSLFSSFQHTLWTPINFSRFSPIFLEFYDIFHLFSFFHFFLFFFSSFLLLPRASSSSTSPSPRAHSLRTSIAASPPPTILSAHASVGWRTTSTVDRHHHESQRPRLLLPASSSPLQTAMGSDASTAHRDHYQPFPTSLLLWLARSSTPSSALSTSGHCCLYWWCCN